MIYYQKLDKSWCLIKNWINHALVNGQVSRLLQAYMDIRNMISPLLGDASYDMLARYLSQLPNSTKALALVHVKFIHFISYSSFSAHMTWLCPLSFCLPVRQACTIVGTIIAHLMPLSYLIFLILNRLTYLSRLKMVNFYAYSPCR